MANSPSQIYIFGKDRVNLRQLVLFNCQLTADNASSIEISRAVRNKNNEVELKRSNVGAAISLPTQSVHLNDIFLSPRFGLLIRFKNDADTFSVENAQHSHELLKITNGEGQEISLTSFIEASKVK